MQTNKWHAVVIAACALTVSGRIACADEKIVLRGKAAQLSVAVAGGGIVEFRFVDQPVNPLNWEIGELEPKPEGKPYLRGHFLCLDRWGAPSAAEQKHGVPFHGEVPRVVWKAEKPSESVEGGLTARMSCALPLAGLRVRRTMRLAADAALLRVNEEVSRLGARGRIYNMVQHPSIAPPFLDDSTLVDSNATRGFSQSGVLPDSPRAAQMWPKMLIGDRDVDLRRFRDAGGETRHDVSSFVFADSANIGWVTACNPRLGLLLGYAWKTSDYPWLNIWRYMRDGKVAARGLEFGTTGYHQPFPVLVKTGRILGRPLYDYIDADQSIGRSYVMFLLKIPKGYRGVQRISHENEKLVITERRAQDPRVLTLNTGALLFGESQDTKR